MIIRNGILSVLMFTFLILPSGAAAQTKDVTVSFLRAASGSLPDRATVSFDAVFNADQGLVEAQGWNMKGKGLSRFSVKDPQSSVIFQNLYCNQDSKAFKELIKLSGTRIVHITGYKGDGERDEPFIFVTSIEVLPTPVKMITEEKRDATNTFRIVLKDNVSGAKTILANVVPGQSYTVDNLTLSLEPEKESPKTEKPDTTNPVPNRY